ncbi:Putative serine/threonine-protein kinase [Glycine soja]|uniref:Putative serine/threonine-protein kinase n=1 Tax=Glycine soja TaxID=3848 RepID=A0A0B2RMA5_GLYSO|nr:Putative serine/threonine-protein kinase [Glycine soja]
METLSRLRHPNIVKILSYWASGPECLLVYEFIEKGNLDQWLHEPDLSLSLPPLPWPTRVNIICGVAHGLSYLHDLDKEEEQNVEALEEVIRLGGGVVEPEGLHEGEVATQCRRGLWDGSIGEHRHRNPRIVGGVGCDVRKGRGQGSM